jgi:hypothetical protein
MPFLQLLLKADYAPSLACRYSHQFIKARFQSVTLPCLYLVQPSKENQSEISKNNQSALCIAIAIS